MLSFFKQRRWCRIIICMQRYCDQMRSVMSIFNTKIEQFSTSISSENKKKKEKLKTSIAGHALFCLRFSENGCYRFSVPYAPEEMYCVRDTCFLELSYLQQIKLWKKKFVAKLLEQAHPFHSKVKFLYQITCFGNMLWQRNSSKMSKSRPLSHLQQMFHFPAIPNLHKPW